MLLASLFGIFTTNAFANMAIWFIIIVAIIALVALYIRVSGAPVPPWLWQAVMIVVAALIFIFLIIVLVHFANQPGPMF